MSEEEFSFDKLPLRLFGFDDIPAVPLDLSGIPGTLVRLLLRAVETKQAVEGLSNVYTIGGQTAPAHSFLFGSESQGESEDTADDKSLFGRLVDDAKEKLDAGVDRIKGAVQETVDDVLGRDSSPIDLPTPKSDRAWAARRDLYKLAQGSPDKLRELLTSCISEDKGMPEVASSNGDLTDLSLDEAQQFALSWTNSPPVFNNAADLLEPFSQSLEDAEQATRAFWPTLAKYGLPYNLILPKKVDELEAERLRDIFGRSWTEAMDAAWREGRLFAIDLMIFESLKPQEADGSPRFTPSTLTLLLQDPATKELRPIAVRVAGHKGTGVEFFLGGEATPGAWLYALQAAKCSITVYGIWLGHVYHWHIVTAAMFMTAGETLPEDNAVGQFLSPQSDYVAAFDNVLLALWSGIAPPTSVTSAWQYISLSNTFAKGRLFFDDDPTTTLERLGITAADFTVHEPWDAYPIVRQLLSVWHACRDYATTYVHESFKDDAAVAENTDIQNWIEKSGDPDGGNIRGLPRMDSREALSRVLTSLIYRTTAHGMSRLAPAANPGLSFVANYPPTLQNSAIPKPGDPIAPGELLTYLPKTGTIGQMVTFYFTFSFSAPYEPLLPIDGLETHLFFGDDASSPQNEALIQFRQAVLANYEHYAGPNPPRSQWPLNIET